MKKINQTFLFVYSILATLFLIFVLLFFLKNENYTKTFDQIQAQQIRIVEPDGTLRMIISNSKKLPPRQAGHYLIFLLHSLIQTAMALPPVF